VRRDERRTVPLGKKYSTELIQEQEPAYQHGEGNPEMDVGRDGAKQVGVAGAGVCSRQ
jgi:hypothetical protein